VPKEKAKEIIHLSKTKGKFSQENSFRNFFRKMKSHYWICVPTAVLMVVVVVVVTVTTTLSDRIQPGILY
jgi:hypothetical protein